MTSSFAERRAVRARNRSWRGNPSIPSWVDPDRVGLDRMARGGAREVDYRFIEPAADAFYDFLPLGMYRIRKALTDAGFAETIWIVVKRENATRCRDDSAQYTRPSASAYRCAMTYSG